MTDSTHFLARTHSAVSDQLGCKDEQLPWLALVPIFATGSFYVLPNKVQNWSGIVFVPQIASYLGLIVWARYNTPLPEKLGVSPKLFYQGMRWGGLTGLALGFFNVAVILLVVPKFGGDLEFLKETPHAKAPIVVMVPWLIIVIAVLVELNFRGFLLGRMIVLFDRSVRGRVPYRPDLIRASRIFAVTCSAVVFAFDPFLVTTFKHLHWVAVWDGLIWGWIWLRLRNLYAVIMAHTVEVIILYLSVKATLT